MSTQAEVAARKILSLKTCLNCDHSRTGLKRKQPALKCSLTSHVVPPEMCSCYLWKRKDG